MTIKEVLFDQKGKVITARVLQPESNIALGYRTPEGVDPYDESMEVHNPDTIEVLCQTILKGGRTREERRILRGQEINSEGLIRNADSNRISHIIWEETKP